MTAPTPLIKPNWYVVQTKPKQEFRALEQLTNQSYDCFLPTLNLEKVRRGKTETVSEPLFSRYLFIRLDMVTSNWAPIRSTRGVSSVVAFGSRFATVSDAIVDALRIQVERRQPEPLFKAGQKVLIESGPFSGLEGIYQMVDGEARALVLIELISQPQKLHFGIDVLRNAA
jgi:transcriptional antiterminator RfaH